MFRLRILGIAAVVAAAVTVNSACAQNLEKLGGFLRYGIPLGAAIVTVFHKDPQGLFQLGGTWALSSIATYGLKTAFEKTSWGERPDGGTRGFPSGHTSSAFAGAAYLHFRYGWQYGLPADALAALVAYSRVESDKHYVRDVIAGAAVGYASAFLLTDRRDDRVTILPYVDFTKPSFGIIGHLTFGP